MWLQRNRRTVRLLVSCPQGQNRLAGLNRFPQLLEETGHFCRWRQESCEDCPVWPAIQGSDQLKGQKRGQSLRQRTKIEELRAGVEPLPFSWNIWGRVP